MAMRENYLMESLCMKGIHSSGTKSMLFAKTGKLKPEGNFVTLCQKKPLKQFISVLTDLL